VILLDTHALVWWVADPKRIPAKARRALDSAVKSSESIAVSSISIWEIAMLVARKRLAFTIDAESWIASVEALPFFTFVPVDNRIAVRSVELEKFPHRDPADRIIVATALGLGAMVVTADARLRGYRPLATVWD
jgi:PIN domain nuclease of toxin-antitoxin system